MPGDHNSNKQSYSIECIAEYCFHAPFRYSQYFTLYFGSIFSTVSIQKETKQFAKLVPFKLIMLSMHTKCYTYVGMLFIYFGLVFNTATPFKLITKLHEVSCHVIVRSRLSLFQGVAGCYCWSQSQPCLRARAGYSLDKSPAHRRALTDAWSVSPVTGYWISEPKHPRPRFSEGFTTAWVYNRGPVTPMSCHR